MIIALPTKTSGEKSFISDHFGRCNFFYIYDTETSSGHVYTNVSKDHEDGSNCKAAEFIISHHVDILISPRLGEKSLALIKEAKIQMFASTDKIVKDNIASYLAGELEVLS